MIDLIAKDGADDLCAREPIGFPGSIQPHGALLVADPERHFTILAASANTSEMLGGLHLGSKLAYVFGTTFVEGLAMRIGGADLQPGAPWETTLRIGDAMFEAASHLHAGRVIVELESPEEQGAKAALACSRQLQRAIGRLRACRGGVEELAQVVVRDVRAISGYERVIVYRFDTDWNGTAIAEEREADWAQSFLGLHFPASDIPRQARELYALSPLRWVPRRDYVPVPLHVDPGSTGTAVDISFARLRSLSPTHMQYHRNMGVDGTMSLSILQEGVLWGLVVCHHRQPHQPTAGERSAIAALTDAFALRLEPAERQRSKARQRSQMQVFNQLLAQTGQADDIAGALIDGEARLDNLIDAAGAAVVYGGIVSTVGRTPPPAAVSELVAWLREKDEQAVFATDRLPFDFPAFAGHAARASGLLAAFLSPDRTDMLLWFRPEEPKTVTWGGDPRKQTDDPAAMPVPRASFERWVETRHGHARAWDVWEVDLADDFRQAILGVAVGNLRRVAQLNEQLRQAQKMEAIGQLTGGLAHDFNNLLTGITGSLDLLQMRVAQGRLADVKRYVVAAQGAASRAAALTHRLLAFSRRQTLDPKPTDVNRLVAGMEDLIRRTVGPAITVEVVGNVGLWPALVDPNQLENALLNLCINARDAMPDGGRLTIETANKWLDDRAARERDIGPGQYLSLCVTDDGVGMSPDVAKRAFDPFFTTKPIGQGTGLGLSMIYGFAKQSNGQVRIYSEVGQGTTMCIYLPRHVGAAEAELPLESQPLAPRAEKGETVLVVDDEPTVRMLIADVLADFGYASIEAVDGASGVKVLASARRIDLLITDVGLPGGMNGRQVADAGRTLRPDLKVLFITGYAENAVVGNGHLDHGMQILTKPFAMDALASRIRDMIGGV